ncbi:hypothetical protein BY458DRAFT_511104 [Sporodiniella umbellata]|nr:hypothetical protein BY458DRAFT_511104 [Sporodiniella umbellata]
MYSPQGGSKLRTPERDYVAPSPLRALSPFVDAIKSAKTKANKDFESFYGSLMSRLTPKTSANRIYKKIPEITQHKKLALSHKRIETEYSRTSLTPLFERHTLREDSYIQNPFYEDSESETTDNASEFDMMDDVTVNSNKTEHTKRLNGGVSSLFDKLRDESKRMEQLQSNISLIKRQSSFLADSTHPMDNKKELYIPAPPPLPTKEIHSNPTFRTPQIAGKNTYLTPPQSIECRRLSAHHGPKLTSHALLSQSPSIATLVNEKNDKEDLLHEISHAKLKSAEIIR